MRLSRIVSLPRVALGLAGCGLIGPRCHSITDRRRGVLGGQLFYWRLRNQCDIRKVGHMIHQFTKTSPGGSMIQPTGLGQIGTVSHWQCSSQ